MLNKIMELLMKKIITAVAATALFASAASADFTRVEAGAGVWQQTPNGYASRDDGDGVLSLKGTYTSDKKESSETYAWILIKHPIPILPNLRLEYVSISDEGTTQGTSIGGITMPAGIASLPTTIDMKQYDIIPYYNLLDNTFWMTVDLGLDVKVIQSDATVAAVNIAVPPASFPGYSSSDTTAIPLLYLRTRVEIPVTNIGVEADVKAITDGTNTMYDARAKVDYTLDFIPVVQPAIEVGYRVQKLKIDDGATQIDLDYSGVYAGLMVRF